MVSPTIEQMIQTFRKETNYPYPTRSRTYSSDEWIARCVLWIYGTFVVSFFQVPKFIIASVVSQWLQRHLYP